MSRMPGFTAQRALLERTHQYYGTAGAGRLSGSVKPALARGYDPLLCCLDCWSIGWYCRPTADGCVCEANPMLSGPTTIRNWGS